jgi:hypothetical protein
MSSWSKVVLTAVACAALIAAAGPVPTQEFRFERMDPPNLNKHPAY